jgi:ankyrin repeat protein
MDSLVRVIKLNNYSVLESMLESGIKPRKKKKLFISNHSPLMLAAKNGNLPMVKLLVKYGAPLNETGKEGFTSLQYCSHYGELEIAEFLLKKGANPNFFKKNPSPIQLAVFENHIDLVKLLLKNKASTNTLWKSAWYKFSNDMLSTIIEFNLGCTIGRKKFIAFFTFF